MVWSKYVKYVLQTVTSKFLILFEFLLNFMLQIIRCIIVSNYYFKHLNVTVYLHLKNCILLFVYFTILLFIVTKALSYLLVNIGQTITQIKIEEIKIWYHFLNKSILNFFINQCLCMIFK